MKKTFILFATMFIAAAIVAQPALKKQKEFGGKNYNSLSSICVTKDSGLIFGGTSNSPYSGNKTKHSKGSYDYWLIKQDATGKLAWQTDIGSSGEDDLRNIITTTDGGYIIAGNAAANISGDKTENSRDVFGLYGDYWIVKIDSLGKIQWDKTFGGNYYDIPYSIEQTTDGGYMVAGISYSDISIDKSENSRGSDYEDMWLLKLNSNGEKQWDKTIGGSGNDGGETPEYSKDPNLGNKIDFGIHAVNCRQTADGGYLVATSSNSNISGEKTQNCSGYSDYWLVKVDASGNVVWDKTIGGRGDDYVNALELTPDGGFVLGGYSDSPISGYKSEKSRGGFDYWIVKFDSSANKEWDKTVGGSDFEALQALQVTSDGGYVLTGNSYSGISGNKSTTNKGVSDYWVVKLYSSGAKEWEKSIGGSNYDFCSDVKQTAPDTYWIGGGSYSPISGDKKQALYGQTDIWVTKIVYNQPAPLFTAGPLAAKRSSDREEVAGTKTFLAYPNPAAAVLHIQNIGKATFILIDQSGKRILSKTFDGNGDLNVAAVPAGTYYLTNTTIGITQKVIITK